jgi:hypothetical protein
MRMADRHDKKLAYSGNNLAGDLLAAYDGRAAQCRIAYTRSDGSRIVMGYEEAHHRLFDMSFDPYQCVERRWGAVSGYEFAPCADNTMKTAWYEAERNLRNQIDRTYDARMDFTLAELKTPGPGKGTPAPPDTDVRAYLLSRMRTPEAAAEWRF